MWRMIVTDNLIFRRGTFKQHPHFMKFEQFIIPSYSIPYNMLQKNTFKETSREVRGALFFGPHTTFLRLLNNSSRAIIVLVYLNICSVFELHKKVVNLFSEKSPP